MILHRYMTWSLVEKLNCATQFEPEYNSTFSARGSSTIYDLHIIILVTCTYSDPPPMEKPVFDPLMKKLFSPDQL